MEIAASAVAAVRKAAAWWSEHRRDARYTIESEVDAALVALAEHPHRGLRVTSRDGPGYRLVPPRVGYRLLYAIDERAQVVQVLAFVHGARG